MKRVLLTIGCLIASLSSFSQSLEWDGISQERIVLSHIPYYDLGTTPFTIEATINANPSSTGFPMILSGRSTDNFTGFFLSLNQNGSLASQFDGQNMSASTSGDLRDGQCHHVALVRDGDDVVYYVDGDSAGFATTVGSTFDISVGTDWYIGNDEGDNFVHEWNGTIKEVRVWDTVRTASQIAANLDNRISGTSRGLIAYFPLNEGAGQVVQDHSINANNGTLGADNTTESVDPTWISGGCEVSSGQTLTFDQAIRTYTTVPANSAYDFGTTDFTLEADINASPSATGFSMIISGRGTQAFNGFFLALNSAGQLVSQIDGLNTSTASVGDIRDGNCHHIALVREGNMMAYYVDGVFAGVASPVADQYDITGNANLTFGNDEANSYGNGWEGQISEVRLWNVARTESELQDNIDNSLVGNETGLVGYFPMTEGNGQMIYDLSSTGNNGTLGADGSVEVADPIWEATDCSPLVTSFSDLGSNLELTPEIYPLPLGESLSIELTNAEKTPYVIYSGDMSVVAEGIIEESTTIQLPNLTNGMYFLELTEGSNKGVYKLVK